MPGTYRRSAGGRKQPEFFRRVQALPPRNLLLIAVAAAVTVVLCGLTMRVAEKRSDRENLQDALSGGETGKMLDAAVKMYRKGLGNPVPVLLARCGELLDNDELELASQIAETAISLAPGDPMVLVMKGRVDLHCGRYGDAKNEFGKALKIEGGKEALESEHVRILEDLTGELIDRKASARLIDVAAMVLKNDDEQLIRSLTGSSNYRLRWNAAAILEAGKKKVDYPALYLLDLEHGPGLEIKIGAARKLGEWRDRRALVHLRDICAARSDSRLVATAQAAISQISH